jgi:hypothetical protein
MVNADHQTPIVGQNACVQRNRFGKAFENAAGQCSARLHAEAIGDAAARPSACLPGCRSVFLRGFALTLVKDRICHCAA